MRKIIMGLGYLEGCGHHPGWFLFFALVAMFALAAGWIGLTLGFIVYGSLMCAGAYQRASDYLNLLSAAKKQENEKEKLS